MTALAHLRRHRFALAAALCGAVAAVLALLAVDARSWQTTVMRDDLRFRAMPAHRSLWKPSTLLPGDPASALIGTGDTIAYRRALQFFWYSRTGSNPELRQDVPQLRAEAQSRLQKLITSAPNPHQRSSAANLLGVLLVTTPTLGSDAKSAEQILPRAASYFREAITLDPGNVDAKQNLELVLRIQRPGKGQLGRDARSGYSFGRGRAAGNGGNGY
jgi:hypothetical protein